MIVVDNGIKSWKFGNFFENWKRKITDSSSFFPKTLTFLNYGLETQSFDLEFRWSLYCIFCIRKTFSENVWFDSGIKFRCFFCAIFLRKWKQNLPLKCAISDVFLPDVCQLRSRHISKYVQATEREIIFWPNCSKFDVECAWNSETPQNVRNLGLFWKNRWSFPKKA